MWGVRNGPPYPLDSKTHARVRKQRSYTSGQLFDFKDMVNGIADYGRAWNSNYAGLDSAVANLNDYTSFKAPAHRIRTPDVYNGPISSIDYRTDVETISRLKPVKNPSYLNDNANDYLKTRLKQVNPGYGVQTGTTNNCAKCSATLTLMKMGYNNIQAGRADTPMNAFASQQWFKGGEHKKTNDYNDIAEALNNAPNGSFGMLGLGKTDPKTGDRISGHAMSWTKTRNGKIRIEDGQNAKVFNSLEDVVNEYGMSNNTLATFSRLDNAEPIWGALEMDGVCGLRNNDDITNTASIFGGYSTYRGHREFNETPIYSVLSTPMSSITDFDDTDDWNKKEW